MPSFFRFGPLHRVTLRRLGRELTGQGTWDIDRPSCTGWQNDLYGSVSDPEDKPQLYTLRWVRPGCPPLLNGSADYAISGIPFTSAQLAGYPGGAKGIIAAPVMASAVGFLLIPPSLPYLRLSRRALSANYTGHVKVPADNLAAQLFTLHEATATRSRNPTRITRSMPFGSPTASSTESGTTRDHKQLGPVVPRPVRPFDQRRFLLPLWGGRLPASYSIPQVYYQAEANEDTYYAQALGGASVADRVGTAQDRSRPPLRPRAPNCRAVLQKREPVAPGLPESMTNFLMGSGGA